MARQQFDGGTSGTSGKTKQNFGGSGGSFPKPKTVNNSFGGSGGSFGGGSSSGFGGAGGSFGLPTAKPAVPQPIQPIAPKPPQPNVGTGYGGNTLSALGTGVIAEAAPVAPAMSLDQFSQGGYAGQDSAFVAEDAAAEAELKNMIDQLTRQNTEYQTQFKGNLRDLGWQSQGDDWNSGSWNPEDSLGAYGQAYGNIENDYAGRGMLDSTFYGQATRDLNDRFNRQRGDLISGLDSANADFAAGKTQATAAREAARNRALAEAYARFTSGLAI